MKMNYENYEICMVLGFSTESVDMRALLGFCCPPSVSAAEQRIHQQKDAHHRDGHRCRQSNSNRHLRNPMPEVGVGYESCREGDNETLMRL